MSDTDPRPGLRGPDALDPPQTPVGDLPIPASELGQDADGREELAAPLVTGDAE